MTSWRRENRTTGREAEATLGSWSEEDAAARVPGAGGTFSDMLRFLGFRHVDSLFF